MPDHLADSVLVQHLVPGHVLSQHHAELHGDVDSFIDGTPATDRAAQDASVSPSVDMRGLS